MSDQTPHIPDLWIASNPSGGQSLWWKTDVMRVYAETWLAGDNYEDAPPADAVKLGDVEALRRELDKATRQRDSLARRCAKYFEAQQKLEGDLAESDESFEQAMAQLKAYSEKLTEARRERDALRTEVRAITADPMLDEGMMLDAINARLDREPGREESTTHVDLTPPGSHCLLSAAELDEMASNTLAGETKTEPAPAPRTLLGRTVPEFVVGKDVGDRLELTCTYHQDDRFQWFVKDAPEFDQAVVAFLRAHAHGHVVEQPPAAPDPFDGYPKDLEQQPAQHNEEYTRAEPLVTRLEVINQHGRALTLNSVTAVRLDYQDEGRTLKVFVRSAPPRLHDLDDVVRELGIDEDDEPVVEQQPAQDSETEELRAQVERQHEINAGWVAYGQRVKAKREEHVEAFEDALGLSHAGRGYSYERMIDAAAKVRAERDLALSRLSRVRELHTNTGSWCSCDMRYPCETVRALADTTTEEAGQ